MKYDIIRDIRKYQFEPTRGYSSHRHLKYLRFVQVLFWLFRNSRGENVSHKPLFPTNHRYINNLTLNVLRRIP